MTTDHDLALAAHGGPDGDEHARPVRADFSTSVNAYGPAPSVVAAVRAATTPDRLAAYPDPTCRRAREALAAWCGVDVEAVVVGAGAAELILAATLAFARTDARDSRDAPVLIPRHAFGEYARAARLAGAAVVTPADDQPLVDAVRALRPQLVFLCTPESPGGRAWPADAVRAVADACAEVGARLVLDQSFDAFAARPLGTPALPGHPAVLHLRSLTKDYALAGVRVGCVVAPPPLVAAIDRARMPWTVSTAAQAAAVAACAPEARAHAARTAALLRAHATALRTEFAPWCGTPSDVHYFLLDARIGDARGIDLRGVDARGTDVRSADVRPAMPGAGARLAGILRDRFALRVRDCASFGLGGHVRIAARTPPENARLADALHTILHAASRDAPVAPSSAAPA